MNPARIEPRVRVEHVFGHALADGDDRVCVFHGIALGPRRDAVAAAELLGLPRPPWFEGVCGEDVRNVVQLGGEMAREAGVPGV